MSRIMFRTHHDTPAASGHDRGATIGRLGAHMTRLMTDDEGMSTAEYAIGTIAAAAFGAILYTVVTGDNIVSALTGIIGKALNTSVG
ncbi:DUF4244 domain-containing protein [Gordonia sp. KTR9]|uniref:DUF4244 domain-containing protein n=1 Tax=Gordonia sp. KTR9 TaxID=337191 RepID=UPI0002D96B22|nr:DUF4244 domain-containing protein [Gordonia sp. KTR9]